MQVWATAMFLLLTEYKTEVQMCLTARRSHRVRRKSGHLVDTILASVVESENRYAEACLVIGKPKTSSCQLNSLNLVFSFSFHISSVTCLFPVYSLVPSSTYISVKNLLLMIH